jgi:hypothetical protein
MRLLAATLLGMLLFSQHALANELALSWNAPSGCPGLAELQAGLETRQKRPVQLGPDAPLEIAANVTRDRDGFRLELVTHTESGDSKRELYTQSCNELARATLLVASLLLSTPSAATPPRDGVEQRMAIEPAAAPTRVSWHATLGGVLDAGKLAVFAPGATAKLGVDVDATRIRVAALYLAPRSVAIDQAPGARVVLQLMAAEASVCYGWTRAPRLSSCAYAELGSLRARGRGLAQDEGTSSLWLAGALGLQLSFKLSSWLELESELSLGAPLRRAQLATRDLGLVYRVSALYGQLQAGLCAYFR